MSASFPAPSAACRRKAGGAFWRRASHLGKEQEPSRLSLCRLLPPPSTTWQFISHVLCKGLFLTASMTKTLRRLLLAAGPLACVYNPNGQDKRGSSQSKGRKRKASVTNSDSRRERTAKMAATSRLFYEPIFYIRYQLAKGSSESQDADELGPISWKQNF